jgi:hypothetical protein
LLNPYRLPQPSSGAPVSSWQQGYNIRDKPLIRKMLSFDSFLFCIFLGFTSLFQVQYCVGIAKPDARTPGSGKLCGDVKMPFPQNCFQIFHAQNLRGR